MVYKDNFFFTMQTKYTYMWELKSDELVGLHVKYGAKTKVATKHMPNTHRGTMQCGKYE